MSRLPWMRLCPKSTLHTREQTSHIFKLIWKLSDFKKCWVIRVRCSCAPWVPPKRQPGWSLPLWVPLLKHLADSHSSLGIGMIKDKTKENVLQSHKVRNYTAETCWGERVLINDSRVCRIKKGIASFFPSRDCIMQQSPGGMLLPWRDAPGLEGCSLSA